MEYLTSNLLMVVIYWLLTALWVVVLAAAISYLIWRPLYQAPQPRRIMYGFLILAVLFLADSCYWSLANTARVGMLDNSGNVLAVLYKSQFVSIIKASFLIGTIVFLVIVAMTYRQLEKKMEMLYFTRFAEGIDDAIGVLSPRGVVLYWNKGAENLYEQPRDRVVGKHIKRFLVPQRLHSHLDEILSTIRKTDHHERFIAPRLKADGSEILVDINITPFRYENGDFGGFFGLMRPVASPAMEVPPMIEDVIERVAKPKEIRDPEEMIPEIAAALAADERAFEKRRSLATIAALALLIGSSILILVTILTNNSLKYLLGLSSIVTLLLELIPIRSLVKNHRDYFPATAINKILNLPDMNAERLARALEMVNTINRSLKGESANEPEMASKSPIELLPLNRPN